MTEPFTWLFGDENLIGFGLLLAGIIALFLSEWAGERKQPKWNREWLSWTVQEKADFFRSSYAELLREAAAHTEAAYPSVALSKQDWTFLTEALDWLERVDEELRSELAAEKVALESLRDHEAAARTGTGTQKQGLRTVGCEP